MNKNKAQIKNDDLHFVVLLKYLFIYYSFVFLTSAFVSEFGLFTMINAYNTREQVYYQIFLFLFS